MYGYIYKTTNLVNGKIYIGQKHSNKFLGNGYLGSGKVLLRSIEEYGKNNFSVELLEEIETKDKMDEREIYWISFYKSTNRNIGYNISEGGFVNRTLVGENNPFYGKTHSEETINKIKEANYGKVPWNKGLTKDTDKRVAKYSKSLTGRESGVKNYVWVKKEIDGNTKTKMIDKDTVDLYIKDGWVLGREHLPPNHIASGRKRINNGVEEKNVTQEELNTYLVSGWKLGRLKFKDTSNFGKHIKRKVICLETGKIYDSVKQVKELLGIFCGNCCKGKHKTAGNLHWMYYEDYLATEKRYYAKEC